MTSMADHTIRITLSGRPDPGRYAAAVLGIQAVLAMVGLDGCAVVWPDRQLVTDEDLGTLADRWAERSPWG
jgi:hypothetical protein